MPEKVYPKAMAVSVPAHEVPSLPQPLAGLTGMHHHVCPVTFSCTPAKWVTLP